jgi:hypothetical protein
MRLEKIFLEYKNDLNEATEDKKEDKVLKYNNILEKNQG